MFWDTHLHCNFSGDSSADPEDMIRSAIEKNLDGICFTDHIDWDYPGPTPFSFDGEIYFNVLGALKEKYKKQLNIHIGVELGLQPHLKERYAAFVSQFDFEDRKSVV